MNNYLVTLTYFNYQSQSAANFFVIRKAKDTGTAISVVTALFNSLCNVKDSNGDPLLRVTAATASEVTVS